MREKKKKKSPQSPGEVITARKAAVALRQGYVSLFLRIILIAVVCVVLFTQVFLLTQARGNSMFPAVKDGDLIFAFRLHEDYAAGDVVVYTINDQRRVGRIVARGNDTVTIDESGTLLVNGTVQSGEILYPSYPKSGITYPYIVPEGQFFILGDYRTQAEDSRDFGSVLMKDVEAKVITILRRQGI